MGLGTALRAPKRRGDTLWRIQDTQFGKSSSRASAHCGAPATSSTFQARGLSSLAFPGAGVGGGWDLGAQDSRPRRLLAAPRSSAASQVTSGRKPRTELPSGGGWGGGVEARLRPALRPLPSSPMSVSDLTVSVPLHGRWGPKNGGTRKTPLLGVGLQGHTCRSCTQHQTQVGGHVAWE